MADYIMAPAIGEILMEDFMEPMGISAYKLAQEIHVSISGIQDILLSLADDIAKIKACHAV